MSTMKRASDPENTQLGEFLIAQMEEKGLSTRDVAEKLEVTYEHMRRLVRGEGLPSPGVLRDISKLFGKPYTELNQITTGDKARKRYGTAILQLTGRDPTMEPLERLWPKLGTEQRTVVVDLAKSLAKHRT